MYSFNTVLVACFVVASTAFAQPQGEQIIRTRDGKSRQGRVISETQKGYLFSSASGTSVIPFESIVDMSPVSAAQEAPPLVPTPMVAAAVAKPSTEVPAPPVAPAFPAISELRAPLEERPSRLGLRFGVGALAGASRDGGNFGGQGLLDYTFGRLGYRLALNLGGSVSSSLSFLGSVDNLVHFNISDVFSLGAGVQVALFQGYLTFLYAGPVLQPVLIKLGNRGQHQLALTATLAVVSSLASWPGGICCADMAGRFEVNAGYAYLF
ncbi:MAG: hypothetical protein Q8K32_36820 [Archangium sp.]|nr:hypothetical protein [Archangium sp.]